jgi:hypothetical protein
MIELTPSILSADFARLGVEAQSAGLRQETSFERVDRPPASWVKRLFFSEEN